MVAPLDAEKLAEYVADSKSFKDFKVRVRMHRRLLKLEKEGKLPNSSQEAT